MTASNLRRLRRAATLAKTHRKRNGDAAYQLQQMTAQAAAFCERAPTPYMLDKATIVQGYVELYPAYSPTTFPWKHLRVMLRQMASRACEFTSAAATRANPAREKIAALS